MGSLIGRLIWGALAGFVTFALTEPFAPGPLDHAGWEAFGVRFTLILGVSIGLTLGAYSGMSQGSRTKLWSGLAIGGLLGAIGASIGSGIGGRLLNTFFSPGIFDNNHITPAAMIARTIALTPLGAGIGLAVGAAGLTWRRAGVGAAGGTVAGIIAGLLFDPMSAIFAVMQTALKGAAQTPAGGVTEVGIVGRALTCILIGAGVGLFTGLVDRLVRTAWLRLELGRNEGRDWVIESAQTTIGRSETATVPLFGDPSVMPVHAMITRQGDNYILSDGGSQVGTYVNGYPVQQVPLFHGAQIRIGSFTLQFLTRSARMPQHVGDIYQMPQQIGAQQAAAPYAAPLMAQPTGYPQPMPQMPMQGQPTVAYPAPGAATVAMTGSMPTVAQPAARAAELVAMTGPLAGQRYPVSGVVEAGREATGIALGFDSMASRRHASFAASPGGVTVSDLGSTNGTFVNDQRVPSAVLKPGDTVRIGITTFRIE